MYTHLCRTAIPNKRIEGTNTTVYTFNSAGKLASITNPDGSTIAYTYDGDGRRVSETIDGVTTKFYYDGLLVAKETDANGATKAEYLYGLGGRPIRMTRDGVSYYYVFNAHGDTIALVDSTGAVKASYSYDPWGQVTINTGSTIKNPFLYAGQFGIYHDAATGLDLMQTRYYNSGIQRFISPDEFPGTVAKPISHNGYIYVHDDPINNVDPDGHAPKWLTNAWNSVKSAASWVGTQVQQAATWVVTKVEQAASWAAAKVQQAAAWVSKKVSRTIEKVKAAGRKVAQVVKAVSKKIADGTKSIPSKLAEKAQRDQEALAAKIEEEKRLEQAKEEARKQMEQKEEERRQQAEEQKKQNEERQLLSDNALKLFGDFLLVKASWDNYQERVAQEELNQKVELAESSLSFQGIDPNHPDYEQYFGNAFSTIDISLSIAQGYGGIRFINPYKPLGSLDAVIVKGAGKSIDELLNTVSHTSQHSKNARWVPQNLKEKLALEQVLSDPSKGTIVKKIFHHDIQLSYLM